MFPTAWESNVVRNIARLLQYSRGATSSHWYCFSALDNIKRFVCVQFCWRAPQLYEHLLASVKSSAQKRFLFDKCSWHLAPLSQAACFHRVMYGLWSGKGASGFWWHMFQIPRRHFYPVRGDQAVWQSRRLYKLRLTENHQPGGDVTICLTPISRLLLEKF